MSVGPGQGACFGCGDPVGWSWAPPEGGAVHDSSLSGRMSRVGPLRVCSVDARVCCGGGCCTLTCVPRRWKPRNHAEQQCQWRPQSGSHVHRPPSLHMGARPPHTLVTKEARNSNKNQPSARRGPSLPCAAPKTAAPTRHTKPHKALSQMPWHTTFRLETGSSDRSRCGLRPISTFSGLAAGSTVRTRRPGRGRLGPG